VKQRPDFNASWIVVPVAFVVGLLLVFVFPHVLPPAGRLGAVGWALVLTPPIVTLLAIPRITVIRRLRSLRAAHADSIVELGARGAATSKDLGKLNGMDHGSRDERFRTVCYLIDQVGLSEWRSSDSAQPEWAFGWAQLSEPRFANVDDSILTSGRVDRGLEFTVTLPTGVQVLRVVLIGAGFMGFFSLSQSELQRIVDQSIALRATALAPPVAP
jgi:hypothetical protein